MMVYTFTYLFFIHWLADFVCQSRWMAENKGENPLVLTAHVAVYSLVLFCGMAILDLFDVALLIAFVACNAFLHWITDLLTSQVNKYFYNKQDMHKFFCSVGFDQYIHSVCLMSTTMLFLVK